MEPVHKKRKQEASKPLSDEEDIGYRTMTREDAAIMQHQQQLTSRQQITQPHGGGKGGVVDPPGSVGILLPQTSTAQSLPSGAGHGGIGVVPNAALMNRYICSEQAIIGASAPGMVFDDGQKKWIPSSSSSGLSKLQIIHTQQNKTFRVVGRNLQHQQQILQPPCGGGVRPPGSVVILSPQTPTAQGLPPGGGIGVVPNAPQMNRSICSEQSIIGACASVMVYDDDQKKWIPSGSSSGLSKVQIIHHQQNNTFRVVGRKLQDHEVVINCSITKGLIYNEATATFHQWRDSKVMYGLSFSSQQDAEAFAQAMMHALEVLSGRVLPSSMQTNPNHNPLAYEEDMDYGTMKTRDDAAIMQHQQKPTSRQQITQPHGNGEGGGVDPPCSVGILLPQIPTSQGLPLGGGIGVVPNAALMNRSICSEQVIIGASAPGMVYDDGQKKWIPSSSSSGLGKLQIIHTQQNKTIRVVARNLQHQQQILQPPCGGGVRPPSSVVILSPQTPTAQGLPPGGGIGVVPNAPQMNRSICSEQSIIGACASVMVYDDGQKKWIPSGSSSGLSKVQIIHHQQNNTFRVVGRKLQDHEIVLNCSIIKGLKYNQATASFHQWRDSKVMYGLSFSSEQDAEAFARAMMHALEVLSGRVPPSSMQTNPNRNSLAYEEDMDYGTMKTRKDEAIMQHHQRLTSRQQITQPHGGGEGGVVGPPDLVGILLPQIPTSKGLPPGAGQGGISVVSNAAQMNQGPPPLQQQQHLTNKQQIPQPHGGGGGGRVDPGIQMPQTSTSQDPTPGGGIGVVPNAALINRSICSEQAIIGARAPGMVYDDGQKKWIPSSSSSGLGKLQIIHTQQNKTIRVVARNLQHQQQILQPPCGGGVRPPSSVVILSPQTPTAQGLPPGGGIGVVPNAPQMNRSICSEQSIIGACASVMVYDDDQKKWIPSGSSSGLSKVQIIHHQQNNTFRVVGRKLQDHEVVINCSITKGLIYNEATATFHQWRDSKVMYGLSFSSQQDAEAFARAMMHALEVLSGRVPPSSMQTNPSHNPLAYEEDMDYSTMKTREDVAILQYQQELTSRQQITQPHGGGEGGGVRRPGSVGILLPQIPTSHGLPLVGGIGVVPNAALMNRSICSEQAIIGASAPGMVYDDGQKKWIPSSSSSGLSKLQIIHTQQNKTLRVVGRNLQHQQQILQPPCGGGVRPPGSVVILSPQTPTAQGLPPGGGIGVVPNAPQMNRSICSEQSIIGACASVMVYDDDQKKWIPSGSSSGLSKVQIIHHQQNNTFRVVGRKLQDHEVVINCSITKGLKYNEATATFHQWRDSKVMYGLSFSSQQDAEAFARAMMRALEVLSGRVPLSSMQTNQNLLAFDEDRTYSTIKTRPQEITLPHGDDGGDGVGPPSSVGILLPQIPGLPHGVEQGGISVVSNAAQINQEPPPLQLQLQQQAHRTIRKGSDTMTVNEHYHPDHSLKIAKAELQEALRKECVETFADYREVFDKVCNLPEHREAASHLTYSNVLSAMRNARHQCFPRLPKSASDFHKLMLTEKAAGFQTIRNEQFYHGCVGGEGDLTLFFVVPSTVDVLRRTESTKLLFDGTFKTKPTIFAQLFMAYAQISGKVFPLAFMPMEVASPKSTTYVTILNKLISLIPPVEVVGTITDFEKSLINACRMVFPNATHQGCLFHFKQALRRCIISKIGISPTSTEYAEYRIAMQLPHLPADKIAAGVEVAMKHIRERTSDEKAAGLFQTYLKAQWLKNVNPQIYSTYRIQTTTNNAAESFHSLMGRKIGVSPSAWIFVEKIIAMAKTTALEIARVQHIQQRREQSDRQRYVAKCTDIFDVDGDIYKFLLALCSKSTEFGYLPLVENDAVEALEDCIICMKPAAISLQPCMHKPFCGVCVWQALNTNPTCPICKEAWVGLIKDSEVSYRKSA